MATTSCFKDVGIAGKANGNVVSVQEILAGNEAGICPFHSIDAEFDSPLVLHQFQRADVRLSLFSGAPSLPKENMVRNVLFEALQTPMARI